MSPEIAAAVQALASLASILIAAVAIIIAMRGEARNRKQFQAQQATTYQIALANVRPIVAAYTDEYMDVRGVYLMNYGVGTAMITSIEFRKGDRTESNLARLFSFLTK